MGERKFWNHEADEWESRVTARELVDLVGRRLCDHQDHHAIMIVLARGWLIERARSRKLRGALRQARVHVCRQLNGRHEQDRADAAAWLAQWGDL